MTMSDPHGFDLAPIVQTALEVSLVATAMILLLAPRDRRVHEAVALILMAVIGRIAMAPLPNVQPVTLLVMLTAIRLGTARGISLGILTAYLSNLYLGGGSWTVVQAMAWGSVGLTTGLFADLLRDRDGELSIGRLCALSFPMAFLFGFLVTLPMGMGVWFLGLPFDLIHAVGNVTIAVWFTERFQSTLEWVRPDLNRGLTAPSRQV